MHPFFPSSVMRRSALAAAAAALLAACGTTTPLPPMAPLPSYPTAAPVAPAPTVQPAPTPSGLRDNPGAAFGVPAAGPVIGRFDGNTNKGVDIGGRLGDPVRAARAGQVVLVSSALPAYGTMVIVKHDNDFITAYAHISRALVAEGEQVTRGQQIADMGQSGTDRVKLRFEIRKGGVAVDPQPYLAGTAP